MRKYLRDTSEFQHVYRNGKRYEGVFITAFVIENQEPNHRLGVTASKKALGKGSLAETGYRFVKRQSQQDQNMWVSLGEPLRAMPATASAR